MIAVGLWRAQGEGEITGACGLGPALRMHDTRMPRPRAKLALRRVAKASVDQTPSMRGLCGMMVIITFFDTFPAYASPLLALEHRSCCCLQPGLIPTTASLLVHFNPLSCFGDEWYVLTGLRSTANFELDKIVANTTPRSSPIYQPALPD